MANPFEITDPVSAFVGTQKGLAEIGLVDAQAVAHAAQSKLQEAQAATLQDTLATKKALAEEYAKRTTGMVGGSGASTPDAGFNMPGATSSAPPLFVQYLKQVGEYKANYDMLMRRGEVAAAREQSKQIDDLMTKANDDMQKYQETEVKKLDAIEGIISTVQDAPSYNIAAEKVERLSPGALGRQGLPRSIDSSVWDGNPFIKERVQSAYKQVMGAKNLADEANKAWEQQFKAWKEKADQENRRTQRVQEWQNIAIKRENLEETRKDREERRLREANTDERKTLAEIDTTYRTNEAVKDWPKYQANVNAVNSILEPYVNLTDGKLKEGFARAMPIASQKVVVQAWLDGLNQYRANASSVYDKKEIKDMEGKVERLQTWAETIGKGTPVTNDRTLREMAETGYELAKANNAVVVAHSLKAIDTAIKNGADPNKLNIVGDFKLAAETGKIKIEKIMKPGNKYYGRTMAEFPVGSGKYYDITGRD